MKSDWLSPAASLQTTFNRGFNMSKRLTTEEFIRRARLMHGDKYDYSKSVYFDAKTKLTIICREHGEFRQRPDAHLVGGCRLCGRESRKIKLHSLIERFNEIHECKYDYSLVEGEVSSENIKIICREHGVFTQRRSHHMAGQDVHHAARTGS